MEYFKNIPNNLDEALDALEAMMNSNSENIEFVKSVEEFEFTSTVHHGLGRTIRNEWELWSGENEICKWFNEKGITHADDMSGIIFTSFYRKVNNKPIDLESQIKVYINFWENNSYA